MSFPIDDLLDKLPSLTRAERLVAIGAYAADVAACACMPGILENARLKVALLGLLARHNDGSNEGPWAEWDTAAEAIAGATGEAA